MKVHRTFFPFVLLILAAISTASVPVNADAIDIENLRSAADAGDAAAQRDLGEALVFGRGGLTQDKEAGVELLTQASDSGDVPATAILGALLLEGYVISAEPERGAQLLRSAADAGSTQAQTTLGYALLWGLNRDADPAGARALLEQASNAGDPKAVRILGQQLLGGWVFDQDIDRGIALLEDVGAQGDSKAFVSLGKFYLYRSRSAADRDQALTYFEAAAELGNGEGLASLGSSLMWSQTRPADAEAYLRRGGELGYPAAWTTLAMGAMYGYLGPNSRSKFDAYADLGRNAGQDRIAVLEAQRQMWGISMRASGPETIRGLEQAAEAGNAEAAQYLIRLVRDGNGLNIRKSVNQARDYLERFAHLLSPVEREQLALSIDVAATRILSNFPELADRYNSQPELRSIEFGEDIYDANPNFTFYLLQSMMRENGSYSGPTNGYATRLTLRSVYRECRTLINPERCNDTVMRADIIGALLAR